MKKSVVVPWDKYQRLINHKPDDEEEEEELTYTTEKIVSTVPQKMRSRAQALLGLLPQTDISWNNQGEFVNAGQCVEGSNICDLVKCVLLNYKNFHPKGYDTFVQALASNNIPETLIQNTKCRSDVQHAKCKTTKAWLTF